eukprot:CAMPEP_0119553194 /NCGR_PEP_ID=MMETSP1352-20130426/5992_1 /TAXON_ID=265584 /ORGANISM="Stauroneis constricta, Strain CCMP1120" /LENGTH=125 /DNA_ID=CAMNT_0007599549 /DNA_START=84 /DNA_END=461 /DNA_ORIENTATION=-
MPAHHYRLSILAVLAWLFLRFDRVDGARFGISSTIPAPTSHDEAEAKRMSKMMKPKASEVTPDDDDHHNQHHNVFKVRETSNTKGGGRGRKGGKDQDQHKKPAHSDMDDFYDQRLPPPMLPYAYL